MTAPVRPAPQAPARLVRRHPVLIALMTAMALAAQTVTIPVQGRLAVAGGAAAALTVAATLTFAGALLIMPRPFSATAGESASTGPAQKTE